MLAAAVAMVHRTGLTVSLDHISFEDVIRDADVARSAVYRRWPYKDLFFSDLVKELAKEAIPPALLDEEYELIRRVVAEHLDWLDTPELRATSASRMTSSKLMWSRLTLSPVRCTIATAAASIRRSVS